MSVAFPIFERYDSIIEMPIVNPDAYIEMLSTLERSDDGQFHRTARDLRTPHNAAKVSLIMENDEAWTAACVMFLDTRPRTPTHWRREISTLLHPYLETSLLPRWNGARLDETGHGNALDRGVWRVRTLLGWRVEPYRLFMPRPGAYVCINPRGAPKAFNACTALNPS